jgi:flagellar hook-associated protein 2
VRENINSQYGTAGFSANILTDASGSRLVITSTKMGEGSEITLGGNSGVDVGIPRWISPRTPNIRSMALP